MERLEKECQVAACLTKGQELAAETLTRFQDADGYPLSLFVQINSDTRLFVCMHRLIREERATMSSGDVFSSFYTRLRDIREYHAKFTQDSELVKHSVLSDVKPQLDFSGEEAAGRSVPARTCAHLRLPPSRVCFTGLLTCTSCMSST